IAHYGEGIAERIAIVPFPRASATSSRREAARHALGIGESDFVFCSFGMIGLTKMNQDLAQAWLASSLSQDKTARLFFVGEK
ncbi:hypothetical protein MXD81_26565, partial [Microbacteriaceae bacterium K1510]|nr:hypothetical protein [Microbacteriaceae bacterium K1510]